MLPRQQRLHCCCIRPSQTNQPHATPRKTHLPGFQSRWSLPSMQLQQQVHAPPGCAQRRLDRPAAAATCCPGNSASTSAASGHPPPSPTTTLPGQPRVHPPSKPTFQVSIAARASQACNCSSASPCHRPAARSAGSTAPAAAACCPDSNASTAAASPTSHSSCSSSVSTPSGCASPALPLTRVR